MYFVTYFPDRMVHEFHIVFLPKASFLLVNKHVVMVTD